MPTEALDNFARYYTEKIWEWIPPVYRTADGLADKPHVLRALVQAIAEQVAESRRSIDRLWENQAIELCDDWAVPLLGGLVSTRLVPAQNRRGRRVDVAKTIFYRRRAGTLDVLDRLLVDIAGWDGIVVEAFRRLGRARHGLDPVPGVRGRFSWTPAGGTAELGRVRGVEVHRGPWDEFARTPDLRGVIDKLKSEVLRQHKLMNLGIIKMNVLEEKLGAGSGRTAITIVMKEIDSLGRREGTLYSCNANHEGVFGGQSSTDKKRQAKAREAAAAGAASSLDTLPDQLIPKFQVDTQGVGPVPDWNGEIIVPLEEKLNKAFERFE